MQSIRDNAWWILGTIFLLVLLLRFANLIGSIWTGLGIAAIIGVAVGISFLPSWKNFAVAAFMGWLAVTITAPLFWDSLSFTLQDALGTRRLDAETRIAETVGSRGASASRMRYQACSEWEDRFVIDEIKPLRIDIATLPPSDPRVQNKMADLKRKEEFLKQELAKCADGLRYAIPDIKIPEPHLPSSRAGATLLFATLLLSGWGIYRSAKDSRWTRWVGGPILILAILYLVVLFFDAGGDKKIEEGIERWQISTKESPAPPPPAAPPAPPKEEKKMIAAKGKQWREAKNGESMLLSTYPFGRWSVTLNRGERFDVPPMGEGSCSAIFVERGGIETRLFDHEGRELNGSKLIANVHPSTNCNNHLIKIVATQDGTRLEGGACRAPNKWCLVYE